MNSEQIEKMSVDQLLTQPNFFNIRPNDDSQLTLIACYMSKLKNGVIGSSSRKENVLKYNFIPTLLSIVKNEVFSVELRTDAAVVIGSLAKGDENHVQRLLNDGTFQALLETSTTSCVQLVEACLRALRSIVYASIFQKDGIYKDEQIMASLLNAGRKSNLCQECVGQILVKSCSQRYHQELLFRHDVVDSFSNALFSSIIQFKIVALDVLSAVCYMHREISEFVAKSIHMGIPLLDHVRRILAQESDENVRLAAARCLVYLFRTGAIPAADEIIAKQVMPFLVYCYKLESRPMVCTKVRTLACETLAYLIEDDTNLQLLTSWNNMCLKVIIQCLCVTEVDPNITDYRERATLLNRLHQASFNTLSFLTSNNEELRRKVMLENQNLLERILNGLYGSVDVQIASAKCLLSFSRSVEQLRTVLIDKPVLRQLLQLMQSENAELTCASTAVVCNLLLEFSPHKSTLVDCGCIPILCSLSKSDDTSLRLNGVWGLMNLAYRADEKIKSAILRHFTPADVLRALTEMSNESLAIARLIGLMRNMLHTKEFADQLIPTYGNSVVQCVIFVLEGDYSIEDKEQALSVLVNLSNSGLGKEFIMSNEDIRSKILNYMMHANSRFQVAATCTICNLISRDEPGSFERQELLKERGITKLLHQLLNTKDAVLFDKLVVHNFYGL